jgi:hypothetical protein
MKKILAILLCAMLLIGATSIFAFAQEPEAVEPETTVTEDVAPETEADEPKDSVVDAIVSYVQAHIEEITVIATLLGGVIYKIAESRRLKGSIGRLNNNAIAVAQNSAKDTQEMIANAMTLVKTVESYKEEMSSLLAEVRKNAEEKETLEATLCNVANLIKTSKLATLELSNEVAELLVLANIPNSKKEELYARHKEAVTAIKAAEEVIINDTKET